MYQSRAGDVRTLFPAFQADKVGLRCITKRARPGECVGGWARQRPTTLLPELGAAVRQRGNVVSWVDHGTSGRLKYVTILDVVHDDGIPMAWCVVMLVVVGNSSIVMLPLIRVPYYIEDRHGRT